MTAPQFIFVTCQIGAHAAVKSELARAWPELRFAFSRPGFLTFKLPQAKRYSDLEQRVDELNPVFARAMGYSLGRAEGATPEARAKSLWRLAGDLDFRTLHVWQCDTAEPGHFDFEPHVTPLARELGEQLVRTAPPEFFERGLQLNKPAHLSELVLDCVIVEPDQWWIGYHRADSQPARWPGGMIEIAAPESMVSRAYLKMAEALAWSQFPIQPGDVCVELGSAPGGASQVLLAAGLKVIGVDPAEMDPRVVGHANFEHIKKRGADLKRREYRGVRWITADMNLAPNSTLGIVESIVTYPGVRPRGLLITLKLADWEIAARIPSMLERVRNWGFDHVAARQLAHNRQEVCLAALRHHKPTIAHRRRGES